MYDLELSGGERNQSYLKKYTLNPMQYMLTSY